MLGVGKRRIATSVIENRAKELAVMLVEAVQARLKIVPCEIGTEACLASGINRATMIGRGNGHIVRRAVVVGAVVMVERRDRQQGFRVERVYPGEVHEG